MNLPVKIRRDWHYYAFAIGLIFISFWLAGSIIRRRVEDDEAKDAQ